MTASNHTITGTLIAASLPNPAVALPLALASHLVLDMLPHYGGDISHLDRRFKIIVGSDAFVALATLTFVFFTQPAHWLLMISCGIVAASPDLLWLPYWIAELNHKHRPFGKVSRFLSRIQWGERTWGWIFEVMWFVPALYLLIRYLAR